MPVRVVTDSSAVVPPAWLEEHRVEVVPLTITWDGDSYANGDLPYEAFAARVASAASTPTTSAPSPGEYEQAYERALEGADALFVVTPPEEVSGTMRNARLAAEIVGTDRVHVFDSRSAAAGQGLVAIEAARAATAGGDAEAVLDHARLVADRVVLWASLERLDYLKRSGRVPSVAAFASDALHLHPVFRFVDGSPHPSGVVRGARKAADRLLQAWSDGRAEAPGTSRVLVFHSSRAEDADRLREQLVERDATVDAHVVQITSAIAAHLGPGLLGLAWWFDPRP